MTTYSLQNSIQNGVTVKVDYEDVAGGYGGWFLLVVQGDAISADPDGNPGNGAPGASNYMAPGGTSEYRAPFLAAVNSKLDHMLGQGHSAKWTATLVQSVTPASIDDDW